MTALSLFVYSQAEAILLHKTLSIALKRFMLWMNVLLSYEHLTVLNKPLKINYC